MDSAFRFLSVHEAASLLGISTGRVYQLLIAGRMKGHKLGEKVWAIDPAEVASRQLNPTPRGRPRRNALPHNTLEKSKKSSKAAVDKT